MIKLGIVVGHEKDKPGAVLKNSAMAEYEYNSQVARLIEFIAPTFRVEPKIFFRDGVGIIAAHEAAERWGANVVLELHFNSHFDGTVQGAEVLCKRDYNGAFPSEMCAIMSQLFLGPNRGIKDPATPYDDGHPNVYRPVPTFLLEPFFGSNDEQAENALHAQKAYAKEICVAVAKHFGAS